MGTSAQKHAKSEFGISQNFLKFGKIPKTGENPQNETYLLLSALLLFWLRHRRTGAAAAHTRSFAVDEV
jgi:hypothetical protein